MPPDSIYGPKKTKENTRAGTTPLGLAVKTSLKGRLLAKAAAKVAAV